MKIGGTISADNLRSIYNLLLLKHIFHSFKCLVLLFVNSHYTLKHIFLFFIAFAISIIIQRRGTKFLDVIKFIFYLSNIAYNLLIFFVKLINFCEHRF